MINKTKIAQAALSTLLITINFMLIVFQMNVNYKYHITYHYQPCQTNIYT